MRDKDYSDYVGCGELAERIRRYWAKRGRFPEVRVRKAYLVSCKTAPPSVTYFIESDMVGGWPR